MRTIESPGVEVREVDLTLNTELPVGTTVFVAGYAPQGPTDELVNVTSVSELEQIYGVPANAAERYFYHTCRDVLTSNGNLLVSRLPYGSGGGDGYTTNYSVLAFPAVTYSNDLSGTAASAVSAFPAYSEADEYYIGQPYHFTINSDTYKDWMEGGITWQDAVPTGTIAPSAIGQSAMVLVNELKTTVNENYAGYYVAIADNTLVDQSSNFNAVSNVKSINDSVASDEWVTLNPTRLGFPLQGTFNQDQGSTSEILQGVPTWDFSNTGAGGFTDSLILATFRLRPSLYNAEDRKLDQVLFEAFVGSLDSTRQINSQNGGPAQSFYLQDAVNSGSSIQKIFINPNISESGTAWFDGQSGQPIKKVRVIRDEKILTDPFGNVLTESPALAEPHGDAALVYDALSGEDIAASADNLYGFGEYQVCNSVNSKFIGSVPRKLEKTLRLAENREQIRIDLVPEGGLGTVWTTMKLDPQNYTYTPGVSATYPAPSADPVREIFNDTHFIPGILDPHPFFDTASQGLLDQATGSASEAANLYETVFNIFNQFCQLTRKDCLHIADPIRQIFVQGFGDRKVLDDKSRNFSQHIYWPLKNLYGGANTSFSCTYANWAKQSDSISNKFVWLPLSGKVAALMVNTDTNFFPWYAPAGLTRGILPNVVDLGVNPTLKHRDLLYKIGINPVVYWPGDGYVVWGQKTLLSRPSAFDRINVRRLFVWVAKAALPLARFFVFEQNTPFTRNRLIAALDPILDFAKNNEGVTDYLIVCDERNNPPAVIDRNELKVSIYIKPVRVAEFILIDLIATRTDADFEELI